MQEILLPVLLQQAESGLARSETVIAILQTSMEPLKPWFGYRLPDVASVHICQNAISLSALRLALSILELDEISGIPINSRPRVEACLSDARFDIDTFDKFLDAKARGAGTIVISMQREEEEEPSMVELLNTVADRLMNVVHGVRQSQLERRRVAEQAD